VPHFPKPSGKGFKKPGAMPLPLVTPANAHLLQQEVVLCPRSFEVTNSESEQRGVFGSQADPVGARGHDEVAEPLSGIVAPPGLAPRRRVESLHV